MEQDRDVRGLLLVCLLASTAAVGVTRTLALPRLDVALWAVLAPIVAGTLLSLLPRAQAPWARRPEGRVVVPDVVPTPHPPPDLAGLVREAVVDRARAAVLDARARSAPLEELLVLARALHEAELELARVTLAAGGQVPQGLRDELALRDRPRAPLTSS